MGTAPSKQKVVIKLETHCPGKSCSVYDSSARGCLIILPKGSNKGLWLCDPECQWLTIWEQGSGEVLSSRFHFPGTSQVEISRDTNGDKRDTYAKMDRTTTPWTLTYYRCGDKVKIINMSEHNVTINRTKGDPLVVPSGSSMKSDHLDDLMTYKGTGVNVRRFTVKGDDVVFQHRHVADGLAFRCVNGEDGVITVTITNEMGG
jgi:hypothetical protein